MCKITGNNLRIVEEFGTQLKFVLGNNDSWAGVSCERTDCMSCQRPGGKTEGLFMKTPARGAKKVVRL